MKGYLAGSGTFSTAILLMLMACLGCGQTPAAPKSSKDERAKLMKEAESLAATIAAEEKKLAGQKEAAGKEFELLRSDAGLTKLGEALAGALAGAREGLGSDAKKAAVQALKKSVQEGIRSAIGPILIPLLDDPLTSVLVDSAGESSVDFKALAKTTVEELFGSDPFEAVFESTIKQEISKVLAQSLARRQVITDRLAELDREEQARKAGVPPRMVEVPSTSFRMGIDEAEIRAIGEQLGYRKQMESLMISFLSHPSHPQKVEGFYIDENEVSSRWYVAYLAENPKAEVPRFWPKGVCPEEWLDRPITDISWHQAVAFCRWMNRRLPTEVEWEAAARANPSGQKIQYYWPWGDKWDSRSLLCNYDGAVNHKARMVVPEGFPGLTPVGSFPEGRNSLGIQDLSGNANEMTATYFKPYPGFKSVTINKRSITEADFDLDAITLKGGDFGKKDTLVTTFYRYGVQPTLRSTYIGFRTAASKVRGKDLFAYLEEDGDIKSWQVDYPPLPSDQLLGRAGAAIETKNPNGFSAVTRGGWDAEKNLPSRADHVAIAIRTADDFRDHNTLKALAKANADNSLVLGYLKLDVPCVDPVLPAGHYFLKWVNSHPKPEPKEEGTEAPGGKTAKPAGKKPEMLPDALLLEQRGVEKPMSVRIETFPPPVVAAAAPTKIVANPADDTLELTYSFPIKYQDKKSFLIGLKLKLEPGVAAALK